MKRAWSRHKVLTDYMTEHFLKYYKQNRLYFRKIGKYIIDFRSLGNLSCISMCSKCPYYLTTHCQYETFPIDGVVISDDFIFVFSADSKTGSFSRYWHTDISRICNNYKLCKSIETGCYRNTKYIQTLPIQKIQSEQFSDKYLPVYLDRKDTLISLLGHSVYHTICSCFHQ